jgi:uncharacterized Zn finger protein
VSRYRFWEDGDRYPAQKQPAPAHGIKVKKAGTSWWGQRWLGALEAALGADSGRLARGRTYARAGRTHDLEVKKGKVHALVTGSRATPYTISIELKALSKETWQNVITGMAAKAQFAAQLLAGEMPKELDEVFGAAGSSLFPVDRADLVTSCSCPDWGDPCKHVAATHYVLGEALDRDPFLLFELRGRRKEQVIDALRVARGGASEPAKPGKIAARPGNLKAAARATKTASISAESQATPISAADYDKPRTALPSLSFSFEGPITPGALLRQLGAPSGWPDTTSPADALAPLVHAAAQRAREIALATPSAEPSPRAQRSRKK